MRNKKPVLFLLFLFISIILAAQSIYIPKSDEIREKNGKQYYIHTVEKGQTVYSISKAYDVTVDEIYYENPDAKYGLQIGQQLWIPTVNKETEVNQEVSTSGFDFFYHIANDNERFSDLALLYNIPERYIRLANPNVTEPLKYGEYVKIPVESSFPVLDGKKTKPYRSPELTYTLPNAVSTNNAPVQKQQRQKDVSFNPNIKVMENYRHVVINGESLKSIAEKYQISVNDLKAVNPGLSNIVQGDRLRIPAYAKIPGVTKYQTTQKTTQRNRQVPTETGQKKTEPQKSSQYFQYTVKSGDNLYKVAKRFGVSMEALYMANPRLTGTKLTPGHKLLIPKLKKRPYFIYYKAPGKTKLKKISKLFDVSYSRLKNSNPGIKNRVYFGQVIKIPAGEEAVLLTAKPEINKPSNDDYVKEKPEFTFCRPKPYRGKVFNIALMVPLYLEEMDSINFEEFQKTYRPRFKPFRFIKFLEGAFIAIDSLKNMGYNLNVTVYDVDNQITKTAKVLQHAELKDMDLIIGPFYSKSFNQVALFADNFNIPIINPFTFREEILYKYNNVIKVKPGVAAQIPLLAKLINDRYRDYKVFFITQNSYKDAQMAGMFKEAVTSAVPEKIYLSNVDINNISIEVDNRIDINGDPVSPYYNLEGKPIDPAVIENYLYDSTVFDNHPLYINYMVDSIHPFLDNASVLRKNLVIIYGDNKSYIMDAINQLNRVRDTFDIEIMGLPLWEQINNMDYTLLNNLKLTYFTSYYINYNDAKVTAFNTRFLNSFSTEPDNYGFSGFDITLFFVKTLADYDKRFIKCLPSVNRLTLENGFKFDKFQNKKSSFENIMWNIIQIRDYKTIRLPESNLIPVKEETDN